MTITTTRRRPIALSLAVVLLAALLPMLTALPAAAATTISVTFSIDYFQRFEIPDDGIAEEGEFLPEVRIGDAAGTQRRAPVADDVFRPSQAHFGDQKWVFTQNVTLQDDQTKIPVLVRIWDDDDTGGLGDDRMDVSPANRDVELNVEYDLVTGGWSGDGVEPAAPCDNDPELGQTCAKGDGDSNFPEFGDGKEVRIGFSLEHSPLVDRDQDGIPDLVERFGVKDVNGAMIADLARLGADPCRRSVVVQLDYMTGAANGHSHQPKQAAVDEVVNAFDVAELPNTAASSCPYPGVHKPKGIDFVHVPGSPVTEQPTMTEDDAAFATARRNNLHHRLRPYAHYAILAHDLQNASRTSGRCCSDVKDFVVTLGSWRLAGVSAGANGVLETTPSGDDVVGRGSEITPGPDGNLDSVPAGNDVMTGTSIFPGPGGVLETVRAGDDVELGMTVEVGPDRDIDTTANTTFPADDEQLYDIGTGSEYAQVGTRRDQAGTIMHELGHALGLEHGGDEKTNNKPNYLSVMNYNFDPGGIPIAPPAARLRDNIDITSAQRRLDYSNVSLPPLNKASLDESAGIGDGTDFTFWTDPAGRYRVGRGNGPLNWNWNLTPAGTPIFDTGTVAVDVNADDDAPAPRRTTLFGFRDWNNLKYRAGTLSDGTANTDHGLEIDFTGVMRREIEFFRFYDPDLAVSKTVDRADALPGDTLAYRVKTDNIGTGAATSIELTDTLPDGTTATRTTPYLDASRSATETFGHRVPCDTADRTVLTNRAAVTAKDAGGDPEVNTANNTATATTTVHAPKLALTRSAPRTVNAGEAMTIDLTVTNSGSATATGVTLTDTLPAEVYYNQALDRGTGPRPSSVTANPNGTTTLNWSLGTLDGGQSRRIQFTARPGLLFAGGSTISGTAVTAYRNANGCVYPPVSATASTEITEVTPTRNPWPQLTWQLHGDRQSAELLARVQATDTRFDGADGSAPDGVLTRAEVRDVFGLSLSQSQLLRAQLLTTYLNLADRRVNATTRIVSLVAARLDLRSVGQAVRHAHATLRLPDNLANLLRYGEAKTVLTEINLNLSERY
ncbi:hypothetical protein [Streptosporangium sp. NPDC002524]|uniref:hypothetical protein n=1 Tax=Streptosporangium sp. NPDC002524 TaxID=3154537 RepID=UPI0033296561